VAYLTTTYVCTACLKEVEVRTAVPVGKEHHALTRVQGISRERCFWCQQRASVERCSCTMCNVDDRQMSMF